jgi:hypothetical protein
MHYRMLIVTLTYLLFLPAMAQTHDPASVPPPRPKPLAVEQIDRVLAEQGLTEIEPQGGNRAVARDPSGQQVRVWLDPRTGAIVRTETVTGP